MRNILDLFKETDKDYTWQTEIIDYNGYYYTTDRISMCRVKKEIPILSNNYFDTNHINLQILENHFIKGNIIGILDIKKFNTKDLIEREFIGINDYVFDTKLLRRLTEINKDCIVYNSISSNNFLIFEFEYCEIVLCKTLQNTNYLNFKISN